MNAYEQMREALEQLVDYYQGYCRSCTHIAPVLHALVDNARAALSSKKRNCDVGTSEEQAGRFKRNCGTGIPACKSCKVRAYIKENNLKCCCELAWAQMPYEEEGAE